MTQPLDWRTALGEFITGVRLHSEWYGSRERDAMVAESHGTTAAEWSQTVCVGMAAGHARIAAHYAHLAYPELLEVQQ